MSEHKKCPYCGGLPELEALKSLTTEDSWLVSCEDCGSSSATYSSKKRAWQAWDTRAEEPKTFQPKFDIGETIWVIVSDAILKRKVQSIFITDEDVRIDHYKSSRCYKTPQEALDAWLSEYDEDFKEVGE